MVLSLKQGRGSPGALSSCIRVCAQEAAASLGAGKNLPNGFPLRKSNE